MKLANTQNELALKDLPVSTYYTTATTSGPFAVPSSGAALLGAYKSGSPAGENGGNLYDQVKVRNSARFLPDDAIYDKAHIIADGLGGSGDDVSNLVPITACFNRGLMYPNIEQPLMKARTGVVKRVFKYTVNVEYRGHSFDPSMLLAEVFLPTKMRYRIDEYQFNGGGVESKNLDNWTLTGRVDAMGAAVNYESSIDHRPNFSAFKQYKPMVVSPAR